MKQEKTSKSTGRFAPARKVLLFWCLFIGLGAVAGAVGMLSDPTGRAMGMDAMLPYFQMLPFADVLFQDFVFSGISLLIVNGLTNLTAAWLLWHRKKAGILCGGLFGVTLMLWICIQFYMFPVNFMSTIYFIFGLVQALTGYAAWVFYRQERFVFDAAAYPHVGSNHSRLVVYFSRMGYTRKLAYEAAERTGAEIYEVRATERTAGTPGFWWCGRFGMHGWAMPIEPVTVNLSGYEHVTLCTPVWVFRLCGPMRQFCREAAGQIRQADYLLVHHTNSRYDNVAAEMDAALRLTRTAAESVCCRVGTYQKRIQL